MNTRTNLPQKNASGVGEGDVFVENQRAASLDDLVTESGIVIFKARTVFPFDFFPNEITICPNRVTVVERGLFYKDEYPIPIDKISGARVSQNYVFAQLTIETYRYPRPPRLDYLSIRDARLARRYILALIECRQNGINLADYDVFELQDKLKVMGMVREGNSNSLSHKL